MGNTNALCSVYSRVNSSLVMLGFVDVALKVISVAWVALAILILALLASALERFLVAAERADDIMFEALAGLEQTTARRLYQLFKTRSKNIGVAWLLSVVLGPFGAYAYLGNWGRAALALVTLNGFGAWWIESWFSIPQLVLMQKREIAASSIADLPFVMAQDAAFDRRMEARS